MRLLLAEDEKALSDALVTILQHNHYSVDAVYNGQDALDYLDSNIYDGVILDIMMPRVDGITVLRTLRTGGNRIPVLLLTAKSEIDDKVLGLDCGADESSLTDQLVFLSRMDEGNRTNVMTDFSISEIAEEAVRPFDSVAQSKGKNFQWEIVPNLSCHGDMTMIRELITLLLDNAIKYSDDEGNIIFTLSPGKGNRTCRMVVSNTTDGIPKGNLDILFERFYRLDPSRNSETGGHGVGLSVAESIVELHRGKISAYSPDGKTIRFTVML